MTQINNNHFLKDAGYSNYENNLALPRHRWYYYKEGFSPLLVEQAIQEVGIKKEDVIIDPFNGSGTTTLTASLKGYKSYGLEVNPFTSFLSKAKIHNVRPSDLDNYRSKIIKAAKRGASSNLVGFSTFSEKPGLKKWLFEESVLKAFEGAWQEVKNISSSNLRQVLLLALISSAMENCNAIRDGKCLRYRGTWDQNGFNQDSFVATLIENFNVIKEDIVSNPTSAKPQIILGDARKNLKAITEKFSLCITSPPYLNTFDYTDIYRPELFLGKFVTTPQQLYNLRLKTVRSHVQATWENPVLDDFGLLYNQTITHLSQNADNLMHKKIPLMVQAYFEDMHNILSQLRQKAKNDAQLWLVVSNSAYADREIPVDLIIGDIGSQAGWYLKEIAVMRYIKRRKTKSCPNVNELRESVIIFSARKAK